MTKIGQKAAVIKEVINCLPAFVQGTDNAILLLSSAQLESIKELIYADICAGFIEYSKDVTKQAEVRTYARSMVMNHLKKAKELNGGHSYISTPSDGSKPAKSIRVKAKPDVPKGVNLELVPEELKDFVKSLV